MTQKKISRRQFLKYGGAGMAGLGLSTLNLPFFRLGKASAALSDSAWQFGVMADTQWTSPIGGKYTCATGIIDALNDQFIQHGCKFVVQVGDLVNSESYNLIFKKKRTLSVRADYAEDLYDAGIGFFPVRGNHESSSTAANEIPELFPQTLGQGSNLNNAYNFQLPDITGLQGLSYSFDYGDVRCVLIDQFTRADGSNYNSESSYNNNVLDQVDWVEAMLASNDSDRHSFVFAHKNLIGQNHKDNLFGSSLTSNATQRDRFIAMLNNNNVGYYMGGHDHMHHRSLVTTSVGDYSVNQIICSSNSYKFYTPESGDDGREIPLDQELYTTGYYIVTVDGPRVTVDFYSSSHGQDYGDTSLVYCPDFTFYLRERFGYSLNGEQYEIGQGDSYADITSVHDNTIAQILDGVNGNSETDYLSRNLSKTINTGWADSDQVDDAASAIFTLWGLLDNLSLWQDANSSLPEADESLETDQYTLSLTYDPRKIRASQLLRGNFVLAARDENDVWVNAVELNYGGTPSFKRGSWKSEYGLGTYGVDPSSKTVWAVLNHESDFVAKLL